MAGRVWAWVVHPEERRLRAPWRLMVHALLLGVAGIGVPLLVPRALPAEIPWASAVLALVAVTLACARFVDRRRGWARHLGIDGRGALELGGGAVLGLALVGGIALAEGALGLSAFRLAPSVDGVALARGLFLFAAIALGEELVFRGYHLTNLAEGLAGRRLTPARASVLALVSTSAIFGVAHATNPNASAIGVANVTLAGVLLGLPFVLSGRLAVSVGLHFGWNVAQSLFDMPVSGQRVGVALVERAHTGPAWLGGDAFGPEGGLTGTVAIAVGILVLGASGASDRRLTPAAGLGEPPPRS